MNTNELESPDPLSCPNCQAIIVKGNSFCGQCGKAIIKVEEHQPGHDVFDDLQPMLAYYFITLMLLAVYKFSNLFPSGLEGNLIVTALDVLIVIVFWALNYQALKPLFSFSKVRLKIILLTIIGAIASSIIVSVVADFINFSINDDVFYDTYLYKDTSYPFLFATLLIAVQPAIFEEVAFRGFLFDNLKKVSGGTSAVYITGFVFAIMHLQIISLLWLIPLGLAFGLLRNKYDTLWYGMVGHFTYNFCITIYEFKGWF